MASVGPTQVDRFKVIGQIAGGGMGVVYEVVDPQTNRRCALKVMQSHLVNDPRKRAAFEREARAGASIESDHVVTVIGQGIDPETGAPWILMELLRGETLEDRVRREGALPAVEVARLFQQLQHALGAAHRSGVLHCDLKPANIFLAQPRLAGSATVVKVLDFGLARLIEAGRSAADQTSKGGTFAWMAPEQFNAGERINPSIDVWPLGLIAFFLLTGREYWKMQNVPEERFNVGALVREVTVDPKVSAAQRARELGAAVALPDGFSAWFARCLDEDPAARWKDADDAIGALRSLLPDPALASVSSPPSVSPAPTPPTRFQQTGALAAPPLPPSGFTAVEAPSSRALVAPPIPPRVEPPRAPPPTSGGAGRLVGLGLGAFALIALGAGLMRQLGGRHGEATVADAAVVRDAAAPAVAVVAPQRFSCPAGMVAIRGGEFAMGDGLNGTHDLRHRVRVSPFCLDATEVTVAQFREYWNAGHPAPSGSVRYPGGSVLWNGRVTEPDQRTRGSWNTWTRSPADHENHPINSVDWFTMQAYCVSRGARLPTEAEWEFAARGIYMQKYSWGNEEPTGTNLNACGAECGRAHAGWGTMPASFGSDPFPETAPVGSFPRTLPPGVFFEGDANAGLYDMAGNVWEWVADGYVDYPADSNSIPVDPVTVDGSSRVLRGGCWASIGPSWVRAARRNNNSPDDRNGSRGGRCARGGT